MDTTQHLAHRIVVRSRQQIGILSQILAGRSHVEIVLLALCGLAALNACYVLILELPRPLVGMHEFRQTHTAISVYSMLQGGPLLLYQTPSLGAPWAMPFEFPLYHWIVAGVAWLGVPLDAAGRLVSFLFLAGCLWPLYRITQALQLGTFTYLTTAMLFLGSPLYTYWGSQFLIETTALFFSLLWLMLFIEYAQTPRAPLLLAVLAAGCMAALAKSTTFPAFATLGGLYFLLLAWKWFKAGMPLRSWPHFLVLAALMLAPFAAAFAWIEISDTVKTGDYTRLVTADAFVGLYTGSLAARFSETLWVDTIYLRVLPDILGYAAIFGFGFALAVLPSRRHKWLVAAALVAFLVPFLTITSQHIVHNYYQCANAIFLVAAVALTLGWLAERWSERGAAVIAAGVLAAQVAYFYSSTFWYFVLNSNDPSGYEVALLAKRETPPDSSLIVFGRDWSPIVPYYAERKSLAVPTWVPQDLLERTLADPQHFLGDHPLGGIVACDDGRAKYEDRQREVIERFIANRAVVGTFGPCRLLKP